jgi:3-carboxy-cis,cis-muconate cycloisomerase
MNPSSSRPDSGPFDFLVNRGPVAAATSPTAWLQALLEVEAALAQAWAEVLAAPPETSRAIAEACTVERIDAEAVFAAAEWSGNPVVPLVPMLKELVGPDAAELVHRGATSQDIFDTAAMLVVRRCSDLVRDRLVAVRSAAAGIARSHGTTAMIGRTLLQHAVPTTFGAIVDRWIAGLDAARAEIGRVDADLPLQLGGPVGDRSTFGERFGSVVALVAARLTLVAPTVSWHTQRAPTAAVAGAWGLAASAIGAIALDIVLLAQSDVGEVAERAEGAGGSSSMAHKHNPVAAISARAAVMQTPGLAMTLLTAAGSHELERAAGAWHAEWPALNGLLRATAAAVDWLGISLERLVVDEERMAANLATAVRATGSQENLR